MLAGFPRKETPPTKFLTFENEPNDDELDNVDDSSKFGSYFDLIKIKKFRYENPR